MDTMIWIILEWIISREKCKHCTTVFSIPLKIHSLVELRIQCELISEIRWNIRIERSQELDISSFTLRQERIKLSGGNAKSNENASNLNNLICTSQSNRTQAGFVSDSCVEEAPSRLAIGDEAASAALVPNSQTAFAAIESAWASNAEVAGGGGVFGGVFAGDSGEGGLEWRRGMRGRAVCGWRCSRNSGCDRSSSTLVRRRRWRNELSIAKCELRGAGHCHLWLYQPMCTFVRMSCIVVPKWMNFSINNKPKK